MSITFFSPGGDPEGVNLANGNAAAILRLLGLPVEPDGVTPAEDFLGRILLAEALLDVATDDEHGTPTVTDGRWTSCGRDPGYLAGRLAELQEIARDALVRGVEVIWG